MTDAHNLRVLSDADAAADLAVSSEDDYKAWYIEAMVASNEAGFSGASAADTIRNLVSERDALAVRVRELEGALILMIRTHDEPAETLLQEAKEQQWLAQARAALTQQEKTNG